jgi:predicted HTH transcriptional regulator
LYDFYLFITISILKFCGLIVVRFNNSFVEKIGSGISRMKALVPDVKFEISSNWFRVIFKREILRRKMPV